MASSKYPKLGSFQCKLDRPEKGLLAYLPSPCIPYAELMRLHKPVGILNIFFPYLFGALFGASASHPPVILMDLLVRVMQLFIAAFILRSAGCTWNDIVDRDLDKLVERTRLRPMARGAVSLHNACVFVVAQFSIWLAFLSRLSDHWLLYAPPLLFLVWLYPFTKRFTDYAQVFLGVTLAWGVLIGCSVVGLDLLVPSTERQIADRESLLLLFLTYVVWTVIHDTVYAYQDMKDDKKVGIKSMAVRYLGRTEVLLWVLSTLQIGLLVEMGRLMGMGILYYLGAVLGNIVLLICMISRLDLTDPQNCLWWFQAGSLIVGSSISIGLFANYVERLKDHILV